jgi:hypothetical protein
MRILVIERKLRRRGAKWQPRFSSYKRGGGPYSLGEAKKDLELLRTSWSEYDWRIVRYYRPVRGGR